MRTAIFTFSGEPAPGDLLMLSYSAARGGRSTVKVLVASEGILPMTLDKVAQAFVSGINSGSSEWCDGSVQAYDAIDQNIATNTGDTYTVSFWLTSGDSTGTYPASGLFQQLSTNGDVTDDDDLSD